MRLLRKIHCFGGLRLHLISQLVGADAGIEFAIDRATGLMLAVQSVDEFAFVVLSGRIDGAGWGQESDRISIRMQRGSLLGRWHKARAPVARPVDHFAIVILDHDEAREGFVLGP